MRTGHAFVIALAFVALACGQNDRGPGGRRGGSMAAGQEFGFIPPERVEWKDGPPSLPPGAKFAVLEGDPSKGGYFAMRLRLPDGYRVPAHWHPNVERVTVISGTLHLGMGDRFGEGDARRLPAGSYAFMPPGMRHFAWAEGETVIQIATLGPWEIHYVNPADDPRRRR